MIYIYAVCVYCCIYIIIHRILPLYLKDVGHVFKKLVGIRKSLIWNCLLISVTVIITTLLSDHQRMKIVLLLFFVFVRSSIHLQHSKHTKYTKKVPPHPEYNTLKLVTCSQIYQGPIQMQQFIFRTSVWTNQASQPPPIEGSLACQLNKIKKNKIN